MGAAQSVTLALRFLLELVGLVAVVVGSRRDRGRHCNRAVTFVGGAVPLGPDHS
jgi:hypothetical protein